jgi:cytochrome P450
MDQLFFYNSLHNPLNSIPGPWHAKYTNLRLKLSIITGRRMFYVDAMHSKYGPFVRISPSEVAVSDIEAFQTIHKIGSGFKKTRWYSDLVAFDRSTVFTMTDPKVHAARRKLLARGFSKTYLRGVWEPLVKSKVQLTVKKMKEEAVLVGVVDILKWWTLLATDVSSHLMFGNSFGMIEKGKVSRPTLACSIRH